MSNELTKPTVTVRYDLGPAEVEGAIRDKLIAMGWTPPGAASKALNAGSAPVAPAGAAVLCWVNEDELPEGLTQEAYSALFPHSKVDLVRMFPIFGPTAQAADSVTAPQQEAQEPAHPACKSDMLVNGGALVLAIAVLRRAGKTEVADELAKTAQPAPAPMSDEVFTQMRDALEAARNGLMWFIEIYAEDSNGADDELLAQIDAALAAQGGAA